MGFVSAATRDGPRPYTYRDVLTTLHSNSSRNHTPPASIPWQAFKNSLDCTLLPPPISQALPSSSSPRQGKDVCEACAGTTQFCAWMCFIVWWLLLLLETVIDYPCLRVDVAQIRVDLNSRFFGFLLESKRRPLDWQARALTNWASFTSSLAVSSAPIRLNQEILLNYSCTSGKNILVCDVVYKYCSPHLQTSNR